VLPEQPLRQWVLSLPLAARSPHAGELQALVRMARLKTA
jgi:hypothetical protein